MNVILIENGRDDVIGRVVRHAYMPIDIKITGKASRGGYYGVVVASHEIRAANHIRTVGHEGRWECLLDEGCNQSWANHMKDRFSKKE